MNKIILLLLAIFKLTIVKSQNNLSIELFDKILNSNKIILYGQISSNSIANLINQINLITQTNNDKNIYIIIDSDGGDLIEGINFINWMEKNKKEKNLIFECVCIKVISSAFNIYQMCDYRYIIDSCYMMQHEPKISIKGTFEFISNYYQNNYQRHLNQYNEIIDKISKKINIDSIKYKKQIANTNWIINNSHDIFLNNLADIKI